MGAGVRSTPTTSKKMVALYVSQAGLLTAQVFAWLSMAPAWAVVAIAALQALQGAHALHGLAAVDKATVLAGTVLGASGEPKAPPP